MNTLDASRPGPGGLAVNPLFSQVTQAHPQSLGSGVAGEPSVTALVPAERAQAWGQTVSAAVSRAMSSSSSVGTTSTTVAPSAVMRPEVERPCSALADASSTTPRTAR